MLKGMRMTREEKKQTKIVRRRTPMELQASNATGVLEFINEEGATMSKKNKNMETIYKMLQETINNLENGLMTEIELKKSLYYMMGVAQGGMNND